MGKYWKIKIWIEIDEEIPDVWNNKSECITESRHLQSIQPENKYECIECDENGEEL